MINSSLHPINELDEDCCAAQQPSIIKACLKQHQLVLLQKCIDLEQTLSVTPLTNDTSSITTNIGIIGDKVGAGKSYVVMGIICHEYEIENKLSLVHSYACNNIMVHSKYNGTYCKATILVVPRTIVHQWLDYFKNVAPKLKVVLFNEKIAIEMFNMDITSYDVIIVYNCYNRFVEIVNLKKIWFKRVVYDEVDQMLLKTEKKCMTRFTWFVTASYENIIHPNGYKYWDNTKGSIVEMRSNPRGPGYISSLFQKGPPNITSSIVLKNKDAFVDQSMCLPPYTVNNVICKAPWAIQLLEGNVDNNMITRLHSTIDMYRNNTEDNIVISILSQYTRDLLNAQSVLALTKNELMYENSVERDEAIDAAAKHVASCERKKQDIEHRIRSTNTCMICFDELNKKTIVECCKSSFCFSCISKWMLQKEDCPNCRSALVAKQFFVVQSIDINPGSLLNEETGPNYSKMENLKRILKQYGKNGKFLICSNFDKLFVQIDIVLKELQLESKTIDENCNTIAYNVKLYKEGSVNALMINPENAGCGLNLENTTDIIILQKLPKTVEQQLIGRAQRYGRNSSLRVWILQHETE